MQKIYILHISTSKKELHDLTGNKFSSKYDCENFSQMCSILIQLYNQENDSMIILRRTRKSAWINDIKNKCTFFSVDHGWKLKIDRFNFFNDRPFLLFSSLSIR